MKFLATYNKYLMPIGLIVLGIVFVVLSFMGVRADKTCQGKTMATIVNIEESTEWVGPADDEHAETVYTQYIDYRVKGVKYENVDFGRCDEDAKVGDRIEIRYNLDDPAYITNTDSSTVKVVGIVGAVVAVAGAYLLFKNVILKKQE